MMKVRREISKNCILLTLVTPEKKDEIEDNIEEMKALTQTRGGKIVKTIKQKKTHPDPGYYFGKGKLKSTKKFLDKYPQIGNVIVEGFLSPTQQRNMEQLLDTTVIDREELILEIFSKRAKTREAKLQVELAEYEYLLPRLRNMWPHLSRQTGGGFKLRGPGETQLEMDKQMIQKRISNLKEKIKHVKKVRKQQRKRRKNLFTASIVGYTNAGKSTLLTQLSNSDLYTEDKLFATLDTSTKRVYIGEGNTILMSDTVGFIKNLPPHLFASFKSTLEEIKYNDLIIILIDVTDNNYRKKIKVVKSVLKELGVIDKKLVYVFNKIDLLDKKNLDLLQQKFHDKDNHLFISALKKTNIDTFRNYILKIFKKFNQKDKYSYQSLN